MVFDPVLFSRNHLIDPEEKDNEWATQMMSEYYFYGGAQNLLEGKNPQEINEYATGNQNMRKYKRMFKRLGKLQDKIDAELKGIDVSAVLNSQDITGIEWEPLGYLAQPINSALAVLEKMPIYVKCTAIDPLARDKKEKDYNYLKNRPFQDGQLKEISQKIGSPIQTPAAPNNAENVDISNFDLDPTQEDELNFYINLFYKLRPESAFENVLLALAYQQEMKKVRNLEDRDQFYYGRSCNMALFSDITGLPTISYVYPGNVFVPDSDLPDYNDKDFRYIQTELNASELMDRLGNEIDNAMMEDIFDSYFKYSGQKNIKWKNLDVNQKREQKIPVTYMEFKSWDVLKIHKKQKKNGGYITDIVPYDYTLKYSSRHPNPNLRGKEKAATAEDFLQRKYIQQTYTGYWFHFSPGYVYKYKKLEGTAREKGKESMSPWGINIWKSQEKSPIELCIPQVDQAQRAAFKLQHAIIMSKPKGIYIDLRYLRNSVLNLKSTDLPMTMKSLMALLTDNNVFLGDSEGVDPNEVINGARPFYDIPGGVGQEVEGYLLVIKDALDNIAKITGWNEALTGQTPSNEGLIGLQKLLLQSAINSLYYAQVAQKNQTEKVFRQWAYQAQCILKVPSSPSAQTLASILSSYKINVIRDLQEIPLHQFGIMVENTPTEQEQDDLNKVLVEMFQAQAITPSDFFTIRRVFNYKDAQQLLAIRERKAEQKRQAAAMQEQAAKVAIEQGKNQTKLQDTQMKGQGAMQQLYAKGQIQQWLAKYGGSIQLQLEQMQEQNKLGLQKDRGQAQVEKAQRIANTSQQNPLAAVA